MAKKTSYRPAIFGQEFVELAEQAISSANGSPAAGDVLEQVFSKAGMGGKLAPFGEADGYYPLPAAIFDAFSPGGSPALRRHFEQFFEVVALPGSPIAEDLQQGDLLIRRALGEGSLAHLAFIAAPEQWQREDVLSAGLLPECGCPGWFARVVEGGVRPHLRPDAFARKICDAGGRALPDQMILRLKSPLFEVLGIVPESCPDVPVPASQRPRELNWGWEHPAVREAQRKLNAFHRYRIAAGLPGLRDAPLREDCFFHRHTFEAVKSFQELVFPGMPSEHDGKIGTRTWTQLDAIVLGPGPNPVAQLSIEYLRITDDGFTGQLGWDQVIGLDTTTLNLYLAASGLPPATMPARIRVELSSRAPNRASGSATLGTPITLEVPRFGSDSVNPNRIIYRERRPLSNVGNFLEVETRIKEVATIVRSGGTSDAEFRRALGWNSRGMATQPPIVGVSTGSESREIPDAFTLFRSAGVEVLEVKVPVQRNWRIPGAIKRLVRSPADVVYYSGHGSSRSGKLLIDINNRPCPDPQHRGSYHDWLGPAELIPVWTSPIDLDVLILAGCSVLKIDFSTSPASGPGLEWARLLTTKGGPLAALLGYEGGAPCDSPNGDRIARQMGERMARGSTNFARDWLEINGDNNANNAVAMDARGYWWIEGTWTGGYDIKGPRAIP